MQQRPLLGSVALYCAAALVVFISVGPFLYMVATSFKTGSALFDSQIWPKSPTLANYTALFEGAHCREHGGNAELCRLRDFGKGDAAQEQTYRAAAPFVERFGRERAPAVTIWRHRSATSGC